MGLIYFGMFMLVVVSMINAMAVVGAIAQLRDAVKDVAKAIRETKGEH